MNPGVVSRRLLNPKNSQSQRMTLTEVHLEPGACQPRHSHQTSEQVWYALAGQGTLLLGEGKALPFSAGEMWFGSPRGISTACKTLGWRSLCI